jgi:hypothetical protein
VVPMYSQTLFLHCVNWCMQMAASGYEGYVADGLDLGPTFDPVDNTNHRYVYPSGWLTAALQL